MLFNKLIKQISYLLGSNIFAAGANFLSVIILAKILTATDFGTLTLLQAYVLLLSGVFTPQAWQGFIKYISSDTYCFKKTVFHTLKYDFISATLGGITSLLLAQYYIQWLDLPFEYIRVLQIMCVFVFINQVSTSIGLLRYFGHFKLLALQNIVSSIVLFIGVLIGWYFGWSVEGFGILSSLALVLGVLIINGQAYFLYKKNNYEGNNKFPEGLLKFNAYTHLTNIVDMPVKQLDAILVGLLVSVEASGVFKIIKQIGTLTTKFTGPVTQVLYPELNKSLAARNFEELMFVFWKFTRTILYISLPAAFVIGLTSFYWLPFIFTEAYQNYTVELSIYLVTHALAVSFLAVHPTYLAFGYVEKLLMITLFTNSLFVLGIYLLAPTFGLLGVVMAIFIQNFLTIGIKIIPILSKFSAFKSEVTS